VSQILTLATFAAYEEPVAMERSERRKGERRAAQGG
jgi:hypothetical protein